MADPGYNSAAYRRAKVELRGLPCWKCGKPSDTVDHVPPLATFNDRQLWSGRLLPACGPCNFADGARFRNSRRVSTPGTPSRLW